MKTRDDLQHHYEVSCLGEELESRLLRTVLLALDLEPRLIEQPVGLSGVVHPSVYAGERAGAKHRVLVQSGFGSVIVPAGSRDPRRRDSDSAAHDRRTFPQREEEVRKQLLFASYDLRARFEREGWACDVLYFVNLTSPTHDGIDLRGETASRMRGKGGKPLNFVSVRTQSSIPVETLELQRLRDSVVSTGSCLLSLGDMLPEELLSFAMADDGESHAAVREYLARCGVTAYFAPPVDQIMLTSLAAARSSWTELELRKVPVASGYYCHPVAAPAILSGVDRDDPIQVALALRQPGLIEYEAQVTRLSATGATVVEKIRTLPTESWSKKIAAVVDVVKSVVGMVS